MSDGLSGNTSNDAISLSIVPNSRFVFLHCKVLWGVKRCSIIEVATFGSKGFASPVTPNVPLFMPRPARPAIWANSLGARSLLRRPSNLVREENAT